MNTRIKSMKVTPLATLAVVVFILASAEAQTPASKLSDDSFSSRSEFRLDLFRLPARKQSWSMRPASFSLMTARSAGINVSAMTPAVGASLQVVGSGTIGRLTKWTGITSSNSVIGNSNIFEDKFGKVGIGTTTPTSLLTVQGMIEITLGGLKFPDGTLQTTAGLASVFHNATLTGNGTSGSPLGVAVPLDLTGAVPLQDGLAVIKATNTAADGVAISAVGGSGGLVATAHPASAGSGGFGVQGSGGDSTNGRGGPGVLGLGGLSLDAVSRGGDGVVGVAGSHISGPGGVGVRAAGHRSTFENFSGTEGVVATGGEGFANNADGGSGVSATGGESMNADPGAGVAALGGPGSASGGPGVRATGGVGTSGIGGDGADATGGSGDQGGGVGVRATGGKSVGAFGGGPGVRSFGGDSNTNTGGRGVFADGGNSGSGQGGTGVSGNGGNSGSGNGGVGVTAVGGTASGAGNRSGIGIIASGGSGQNGATRGLAGDFQGDVKVTGDLNVSGTKNFKIDHPLDPENKYLYHAAIESSEVLNVYSGNVKTNEKGEATVTLPDWFEALNQDFRYQLTVVGTFAQAFVSDEIQNNRFKIRTNTAGVKVSWQVIGVRSDAMMRKHPFNVEEDKRGSERGTYLSPEAFGQTKSAALNGREIQK